MNVIHLSHHNSLLRCVLDKSWRCNYVVFKKAVLLSCFLRLHVVHFLDSLHWKMIWRCRNVCLVNAYILWVSFALTILTMKGMKIRFVYFVTSACYNLTTFLVFSHDAHCIAPMHITDSVHVISNFTMDSNQKARHAYGLVILVRVVCFAIENNNHGKKITIVNCKFISWLHDVKEGLYICLLFGMWGNFFGSRWPSVLCYVGML